MNETLDVNDQSQSEEPRVPDEPQDTHCGDFDEAVIAISDYLDASRTYPFTTW